MFKFKYNLEVIVLVCNISLINGVNNLQYYMLNMLNVLGKDSISNQYKSPGYVVDLGTITLT